MDQSNPGQPSKKQMTYGLISSVIPLLCFWIVESYYESVEAGVIAAIVIAFIEVLWVYWREKRWETLAIASAGLVVLMGGVSWYFQSGRVIMLKPAIFEGIFAAVFIGSSLAGKPFMVAMARKQLGNVEFNDFQLQHFAGLNWRVGFFFLIHTLMTLYAAFYLSRQALDFTVGILFFILFFFFFVFEYLYSRRKMKKQAEKWAMENMILEQQREMYRKIRRGSSK